MRTLFLVSIQLIDKFDQERLKTNGNQKN